MSAFGIKNVWFCKHWFQALGMLEVGLLLLNTNLAIQEASCIETIKTHAYAGGC